MLFDIISRVRDRYKDPNRHYHNWTHIEDCLTKAFQLRCSTPELMALLYHDAVYLAGDGNNENNSAALFEFDSHLLGIDIPEVRDLILATKHKGDPKSPSEAIVMDIDMSILAGPIEKFHAYDNGIRAEYAHVPDEAYRQGRKKFLQSLLVKKNIFFTPAFKKMEPAARFNIQKALGWLKESPT